MEGVESMNFLFVMPRFIQNADESYMFPLGMAYVSASLKQVCETVFCLNLNVNMGSLEEELSKAIETYKIDAIATSGLSPHFRQVKKIIQIAKSVKPDIITMAGGGMVTATPEVILRGIPELDIGMIAEGEVTIQELYQALEKQLPLSEVKGIVYRDKENNIVRTRPREDIEDLDSLPFPDYDGFQYDGKNEISICTSRSCPFSCTFCFHTCGKKYRARTLDNVFEEIDWLVKKYDVKFIGILDELFSINNEKMEEFCNRIEKYGLRWGCQMRVDRINVDILKKMKKAGCISMSFGIESADNRILESMEKHTTIEQVEKALQMAREAKICPFGNLLLGDKEDTVESFQKSLEWYQSHPDIQLGFNKVLVLPGSKLYKYAVENRYILDEVKYLEDENYAINITRMSDEEYKNCVTIMDNVVANREYPIDNMQIEGIVNAENKAVITGECSLCRNKLRIHTDDCLGMKNATCPECGKNYTVNLYQYNKKKLEKKLESLWNDKKVVIWGMGNEGIKMLYQSEIVKTDNVYLVDRNVNKQRIIEGKEVYPTEKVEQLHPDIILIGTNAPVTNASIRQFINREYPQIQQVYNLNQYIFELIKEII